MDAIRRTRLHCIGENSNTSSMSNRLKPVAIEGPALETNRESSRVNIPSTQALRLAVIAHQNGDLEKAEWFYGAILNTRGDFAVAKTDSVINAVAHNNLGFIQQHQGNLEGSIRNYRDAVRMNPRYFEAHNNLGYALQLQGQARAAIESCKKAIEINPTFIEAYHNLGQILQSCGDLKGSADCYRQLVDLLPDNPDTHNAFGVALYLKGDLEAAISSYKKAIRLDPRYSEAYNNMGGAQLANGEPAAAVASCKQAIEIKPDYANAYQILGHALSNVGDVEAAIEAYQKALALQPGSAQALNNLGNAMRAVGRYEEALGYFDELNESEFTHAQESGREEKNLSLNTMSQALECLFHLGRYEHLQERLERLAESSDINRRVSAVSAYVSHQLNIKDRHQFCRNPMDFIHIGNLHDHIEDVPGFTRELIKEGASESQVWEPEHGVTKSGYQTPNTIFEAGEFCARLEEILRDEIAAYQEKFRAADCAFLNFWPAEFNLKGWHVRLLKCGYQESHIHPSGWLSGVVYLKTLNSKSDAGAIEFSLRGYDLPVVNSNVPTRVHRPQCGEIALFPSSLFHRTIPFTEDTERCVIAFNLVPAS